MGKRVFIVATATVVLAAGFFTSGVAQTVFKCKAADGSTHFTDTACPNTNAAGDVVHRESAQARAAREQREQVAQELRYQQSRSAAEHAAAAIQAERERIAERDAANTASINQARQQRTQQELKNAVTDARADASDPHLTPRQRAKLLQQANQLAAQAVGLRAGNSVTESNQDLALTEAQEAAEDQEREIRRLRNEAQRQRNEAATPKFNPQTGQWCRTVGGTVECH